MNHKLLNINYINYNNITKISILLLFSFAFLIKGLASFLFFIISFVGILFYINNFKKIKFKIDIINFILENVPMIP